MFGLSKPQPKAKGAALAQAQNQAPDSIPGMFKPGEFVLPPDTVHAMGGKQALQGVVDATHAQVPVQLPAQVDGQARGLGLKPEVFFANGGAPEDQLAKSAPSPGNTFPGNRLPGDSGFSSAPVAAPAEAPAPAPASARTSPGIFPGNRLQGDSGFSGAPIARTASASAPAVQDPGAQLKAIADQNSRGESYGSNAPNMANLGLQSPKPAQASAPAAPPATGGLSYSDNMRSIGDDIKRSWGAGNYGEAIGKTVAGTVGGITTPVIDGVVNGASGVSGFARGLFGMESDSSAAAGVPAAASSASPAANRAAPAGYTQASQGVMGPPNLSQLPSSADGAGAAATTGSAQSKAGTEVSPGVFQHGRGQYSDQAGGMGLPSGFTGRPNAQNDRAAQNLASSQPGALAAPADGQTGFGLNAPTVAHSGNDWAARQRLKNLETSASSITNTPRWGGKGAMGSPDVQNFIDASRADLAAQGKQVDANLQTMGFNTALARERMGQQGANQRAALAESGASARANGQLGLGLGRLALDQSRAGSEDRLREPQIRAAERIGQMQEAYINAETPEQKAAIAAEMRAYSGKVEEDRWKSVALQGGTDAAGNKTESILGAVNERTGEMKRMGAQQQAPQYVEGGVYQDPQGRKQRWNGKAFEPL